MESPDGKIMEISKDLVLIQGKAATLVINDQRSMEHATSLVAAVKKRWKRVEDLRTFFTKPLNDQVKNINAQFRPIQEALEQIETEVKKGMSAYAMEQERIRRAEEARLQKEADEKNKKEEKKATKAGVDFVPTTAPVVASTTAVVKTSAGKAVNVMEWKFEITDPTAVPREYCAPDEGLIRLAVKKGERKIKGVKIYEDVQVRIGR